MNDLAAMCVDIGRRLELDRGMLWDGAAQPTPEKRSSDQSRQKRLRADMATRLRATTGEPEPDLAHLSDEGQLIALLQ